MPSLSKAFARYCPLVAPLAGAAYAIDLALSSAFFSASTELMSGFAAPFCTARPIWARASVCVLPPTILASLTSLSTRGLVRIATSISSPAATFFSMSPAVDYSIFSLLPEAASKAGASSCKAARIAPALSTFSSAPLASATNTLVARAKVANSNRNACIIIAHLQVS